MQKISIKKIIYYFTKSVPALGVTFAYVIISMIFGTLIGALIYRMKTSKYRIFRIIASLYVTIVRCTPSLVMLFLVFYGLPLLAGGELGEWLEELPILTFVCITFSVFIGASSSELIRAALEAVAKGQKEAGLSVGMSSLQTFVHVLLPQMLRNATPNIGNTVILLIKEGALAYTIGLRDVLGQAYYLSGREMNAYAVSMYIALTLIYWPLTIILERLFASLEHALTPWERKNRHKDISVGPAVGECNI
ncbi:MAG: amino acid ABC transporter permease [Lachnospiraceae bacterium]|nr:amino acid ABC transporter permease [Lachnospiraceae bacterium]